MRATAGNARNPLVPNASYRADIDGLRALAVVAVVLYHAWPRLLPGGFVGVDVFFVVSGYLITNLVVRDLERDRFSLLEFYHRRVRRLFPALSLVLLACLVLGWLVLFPDEYARLGKHTAAGAAFVSNLALLGEAGDYFHKDSATKPLRHLWSLGIEEQFYFFFPPVLVWLSRRKPSLPRVLWVIALVSFAIDVFFVAERASSWAFYHPLARAWELMVGALLSQVRVVPRSVLGATLESSLGLVLIACAAVFLNDRLGFPGAWALLPTVGAALVIHASEASFLNGRVLGSALPRSIGLLSYPLYLWHWPLLAFAALLTFGAEAGAEQVVTAGALLIALALSIVTYLYVERPVRARTRADQATRWSPTGTVLVSAIAFLGALGLFTWVSLGFPIRLEAKTDFVRSMRLYDASTQPSERHCPAALGALEFCTAEHADRPPTDVLLGDSHANHLYPGLAQRFSREPDRNLAVLAKSATPPLLRVGVVRHDNRTEDDLLDYVASSPSVKNVYLAAFWSDYSNDPDPNPRGEGYVFEEPLVDLDHETKALDRNAIVGRGLARTLEALTRRGKHVVVFLDIPRLPFLYSTCLPRPLSLLPERFSPCRVNAGHHALDHNAIRTTIRDVVARFPGASLFDPVPVFCDGTRCRIMADGKMLYADEHHLSIAGAEWLARSFAF